MKYLTQGETVYIKLKPYNSYCVEKLWLNNKEGDYLDVAHDSTVMRQVLDSKGMTGP